VLTFGVGKAAKAEAIEVRWPSGQLDRVTNVAVGQAITIIEGKGQRHAVHYRTPRVQTAAKASAKDSATRP
jgi:hypothetical protein